jgi:DNA-binding transcriptional MerR regulator
MTIPPLEEHLRIGELSRRTGVPAGSLRAWERRYGLLAPGRTDGNFRLYGPDDVVRVRAMQAHLERGVPAAEAARLALSESAPEPPGSTHVEAGRRALQGALDGFDEAAAQAALDGLLASMSVTAVLRAVVIPYLHDLGERWERGEATVAQEHFASNVVRGRLLGLARGWGLGTGRLAVLACVAGEQHDLPLLCFGLSLRTYGWRIGYLGADTPIASLEQATRELAPAAVVVSGTTAGAFDGLVDDLRRLSRLAPLHLAGRAASAGAARAAGAAYLDADVFQAAERIAEGPS